VNSQPDFLTDIVGVSRVAAKAQRQVVEGFLVFLDELCEGLSVPRYSPGDYR
jgi:hypothetical protein